MSFTNYLNRFRQYLRPGRQRPRPNKLRSPLRVEVLEDRMLLSTLAIGLGGAVYTGGTTFGDSLTLSERVDSGSTVERIFTDPVETISVHVTSPFIRPQFTGSGTHTVTWFVNSGTIPIAVNMQALNDSVEVQSIDVATTVTPGGLGGTVKVDVQTLADSKGFTSLNIKTPVTVTPRALSVSTTNVIVDDSADSSQHHWTLSNTSIANEYGTVVDYQQSSVGTLNVTLTGSNGTHTEANLFAVTNTLSASGFASGTMTINTGAGVESVSVQATAGPLAIQGHGGEDGVGIGGPSQTVANIMGSVTVRDTAPAMSLAINDTNGTTSHTNVTVSDTAVTGLAPATIFYQASGLLNTPTENPGFYVDTGRAPDTVTVTNIPTFTNIAANNLSGTDQVNIQGITGNLPLYLYSPPTGPGETGTLKAIVGSSATGTGGTLAGINGSVVLADANSTNLVVDDSGDTTARTVTMTESQGPISDLVSITGLAPNAAVYYFVANIYVNSTLTVNGGSGGDTFNITNTNIQLTNTTINGKGGDTFNVSTTQSPLTLNTGTGSNHVNIQGTSLNYLAVMGPAPLYVVGHGGNDTVAVGSLAPALGGTVANLFAPVYVSDTTNSTALVVDDSGDTTARVVGISSSPNEVFFSGTGSQVFFPSGIKSVDVYGGTSDKYELLSAYSSFTPLTIHGGAGSNTLESNDFTNNNWFLSGTNAGQLRNVSFQNIQNLQGGSFSLEDSFTFLNGAGVTGSITGSTSTSSVASLDYSQYLTPVTVDLKIHFATAVAGGVAGIKNVTGGQGNNILVGDGNNNVLAGGSGRDILISGGNSTLEAGHGEAILLGAHYVNDTSLTALNGLMAEWGHTYDSTDALHDYQVRAGHLEFGGGLNGSVLLNSTTVFSQPGTTTLQSSAGLFGGGGLDLLFFDTGDVLSYALRFGEVAVFV
jgi:hypothetical protein